MRIIRKILAPFRRKRRLIVGVDFDGTVVECAYPGIGKLKFCARRVLRYIYFEHQPVLWTCREGKLLDDARTFCAKNGIYFDYINNNTLGRVREYGGDCRKLSCDLLIDDKACFVFWPWVFLKVLWLERRW